MKKSCRKARIWQTGLIFCAVCAAIAGSAEAAQKLERQPSNKIETTATGRVSATIVALVSAESANDLTFGMMVKNNQGKVTVDEDGNRTTTGPGLATSSYSAGSVKLKGPKAQAVTVDIPDARIYNNEDKSIDIHSFTTDAGKGNIVALDRQNGEATVDVGATLNIKNKETQGGSRNGVYILQTSY